MKRQAVGTVLCALLFISFVHEFLARSHMADSLKQQHSPLLSRTHESDNSPDPDSCGDIIIVIGNSNSGIIGVANKTANIAFILDVKSGIVGLFNSTCGTVILINLDQKVGFYISGSISSKLWDKSQSLEKFILNLKCLKEFQELGEKTGQKFSCENVSSEITVRIRMALLALSSSRLSATGKPALELLLKISFIWLGLERTTLKGIETVFGSGVTVTTHGLKDITAVKQGLASLVARLKGGISVLIKHNVKLSLKAILSAPTGADALLYILVEMSKCVDLKEVLCNALNDIPLTFGIVYRLAGNETEGLRGLIEVNIKTFGVIKNRVSITDYIETLVYFVSSAPNEELLKEDKAANQRYKCEIEKHNLTNVLSKFYAIVKDVLDDKWCVNDINISAIIPTLVKEVSCPTKAIVKLLVAISKAVPLKNTVSALLVQSVELLTTPEGLVIIHHLIPNLKLDCEDPQKIAADILKKLNVEAIEKEKDPIKCIESIPILGDIFKAVAEALTKCGKDSDLAKILESDIKCLVEKIVDILTKASKGDAGGDANGDPTGGGIGNADGTTSGTLGKSTNDTSSTNEESAREHASHKESNRSRFKTRAHGRKMEGNSKHQSGHSKRKYAKENKENIHHEKNKYAEEDPEAKRHMQA